MVPQAWVGLGTASLVRAQRMPPGPARGEAILYAIDCNRRALTLDGNTPDVANNFSAAEQMLGR